MYISSNLERELSAGDKALRYRIAMDIVSGKALTPGNLQNFKPELRAASNEILVSFAFSVSI